MAGGAHYTLAHAETRHKSVMAATLHIIVKAEPLGRLRSTVVRRILLWTWLARLGRSPAARAGAPGRK